MGKIKGTVKSYNRQKGYGFLEVEETGEEVFLYHTALLPHHIEAPKTGQSLYFEIAAGEKGPQAVHVSLEDEEEK